MRFLLRAGQSPFARPSEFEVLEGNPIGNNSGNLLFAHAVYKHLSVPGATIDVNRYKSHPRSAGEINEKYDAFVIPLANAFRGSFMKQLRPLTALVKELKIPCVVVGVGGQAPLGSDVNALGAIDEDVKAFVSAVLDKSATVGVRGDFTNEYLRSLGFDAVETIGCPSFYLYGDKLHVDKPSSLNTLAYNLTPGMKPNVAAFFEKLVRAYPNASYVAQDRADLELLLLGNAIAGDKADAFPRDENHPSLRNGRAVMFSDASSWIQHMRQFDFTIGTRIHGNMFALHAGTPAFLIAHDSRTEELADYLKIPSMKSGEVKAGMTAQDLFDRADYSLMEKTQGDRFERYKAFLDKNSLDHLWHHDGAEKAFEGKLSEAGFSQPIRASSALNGDASMHRLVGANKYLRSRVQALEGKAARATKTSNEMAKRLSEVERRLSKPKPVVTRQPLWRRILKRLGVR